jgi:hypothetical protein
MSHHHRGHQVGNAEKFDGVFHGAAKLLYESADIVDGNRNSHPLLVAIEKGDVEEVTNQLCGSTIQELFEYVTDYVSNVGPCFCARNALLIC